MQLTLQETAIVKYARKIRDIQKTQIEPYEKMIQDELVSLIPSLSEKNEDGVVDWTCDIMNCSDDMEVISTITRIREIERERCKTNQWVCKYCGKNTFDDDVEYLFGTNHISCVLTAEENEKKPLTTVDKLQNQMSRMQDYITQLEARLSQLETHYDEPTN